MIEFLTANCSCTTKYFWKTLIEVCNPHFYASFGTFCVQSGQFFEAELVFEKCLNIDKIWMEIQTTEVYLYIHIYITFFRGAPDARVITLSSVWHKQGSIHWDDPNYAQPQHRKYRASEAFSQSKLANVLFTRELARRLEGTGVNA